MNSRERRRLAAIQHNDAIEYEKWLIENTLNQTRRVEVEAFQEMRKFGLSRQAAFAICSAVSELGMPLNVT